MKASAAPAHKAERRLSEVADAIVAALGPQCRRCDAGERDAGAGGVAPASTAAAANEDEAASAAAPATEGALADGAASTAAPTPAPATEIATPPANAAASAGATASRAAFEDAAASGKAPAVRLALSGVAPLSEVVLSYEVENRFFAMSYNLAIVSSVQARRSDAETFAACPDGIRLVLRAAGKERTFEPAAPATSVPSEPLPAVRPAPARPRPLAAAALPDPARARLAEVRAALEEPIVLGRLSALDVLDAEVAFSRERGAWDVRLTSMVGSSTWVLVPPVMQTITPTSPEAFGLVEAACLLAAACL